MRNSLIDDNSPQLNTSLNLMDQEDNFSVTFNEQENTDVEMFLIQENTLLTCPIKENENAPVALCSPRTVKTSITTKAQESTLNENTDDDSYKQSEIFEGQSFKPVDNLDQQDDSSEEMDFSMDPNDIMQGLKVSD